MSAGLCSFCQRPQALRSSAFTGTRLPVAQPVAHRTQYQQSAQAAQSLQGVVIGVSSSKTAVVNVDTFVKDRIYKKQVRKTTKYQVHDESETTKVGDVITMEPSRPYSRHKRFVVGKILQRSTL